jgi:histidinol-phosphate phosphatase family protein
VTSHLEPAALTQAVILAGGRGERLGPLTDTIPKPMIEFHGRPFLEYLIEELRSVGIQRILLLLGYLPDPVVRHFGNGQQWGVSIDHSIAPARFETATRIRIALERIDPVFMLLYCDNLWPVPLDRMWRRFAEHDVAGMITVYRNRDHHSRDNVRVSDDGYVLEYDPTRTRPELAGVEIGYAILRRSAIEALLPAEDAVFQHVVYPELARRHQLLAFQTDHRYYSVGAPDRLPATAAYLARRPALLLDRDGVLNRRPRRAEYVRRPEDLEWLPGALEAIRLLTAAGYRLIVISNQAGVARGEMSRADLAAVEERMLADAVAAGGRIEATYYCLHDWDAGCDCRKPRPGMLFDAQRDLGLDLSRTPFVGDDERDGQAAAAAGAPFLMVTDERPLLTIARSLLAEVQD